MAEQILRRRQVELRIGVSRSTIYAWIGKGDFPAPVRLGTRAVGWLESDVERWLVERQRLVTQ
jgi:prophage regulatory protein